MTGQPALSPDGGPAIHGAFAKLATLDLRIGHRMLDGFRRKAIAGDTSA